MNDLSEVIPLKKMEAIQSFTKSYIAYEIYNHCHELKEYDDIHEKFLKVEKYKKNEVLTKIINEINDERLSDKQLLEMIFGSNDNDAMKALLTEEIFSNNDENKNKLLLEKIYSDIRLNKELEIETALINKDDESGASRLLLNLLNEVSDNPAKNSNIFLKSILINIMDNNNYVDNLNLLKEIQVNKIILWSRSFKLSNL